MHTCAAYQNLPEAPPPCIARWFPVLHVVVSSGNILPTPAEAEGKLQLWESWWWDLLHYVSFKQICNTGTKKPSSEMQKFYLMYIVFSLCL